MTETIKEEMKEEIEWLEKMKEVQRIQYDYFKHLTTLGSGSILFMILFWEKLFSVIQVASKVCGFVSLLAFAFTIVFSLSALPSAGNIILYINALQKTRAKKDLPEESKMKKESEWQEKIDNELDNIHGNDLASRISYYIGLFLLLVFAAINIIN